jgi:putative tricarboxylic transport membrane protein
MKRNLAERLFPAAVILGAAALLPATLAIPAEARTFPAAVLAAIVALSLWIAVRGGGGDAPVAHHATRLGLAIGAVGAFLLFIPLIGFFPSAALLMVFLPVALGYRVPIVVLPVTVGFLVLVWVVFVRLFAKPLPTGMIWGG